MSSCLIMGVLGCFASMSLGQVTAPPATPERCDWNEYTDAAAVYLIGSDGLRYPANPIYPYLVDTTGGGYPVRWFRKNGCGAPRNWFDDSFGFYPVVLQRFVADVNDDDGVTVDDLVGFIEMFAEGDTWVDLDEDGGVDVTDLLIFFIAFDAGR